MVHVGDEAGKPKKSPLGREVTLVLFIVLGNVSMCESGAGVERGFEPLV